ncbi:uncharacterized protein LOC122855605 [Aphidius gifuensis]|nr:uncharacterized protein LOC122855605 [Aphidius gifuensis]
MSGERIGIISDENFDNEKLLVTAAATAAADASKVIAELLINELSETISDAVGEAVAKILLSKKKSLTKATAKALISRRSQSTNSNVNVNNNHHRKPVEPIESSENFKDDNDDFDNKLITKKKQLARWPDDDTHYGEKKINNELKDDCGNPLKKRANSRRCFKRLIQQLFFE